MSGVKETNNGPRYLFGPTLVGNPLKKIVGQNFRTVLSGDFPKRLWYRPVHRDRYLFVGITLY